jgi:hypothetical protein
MAQYETSETTGKGKLFFDSKIGNVVNGAVAAALLYVADAIGSFDFTPLPDVLEPLAVAGAAVVVGLITSKFAPRRTRTR